MVNGLHHFRLVVAAKKFFFSATFASVQSHPEQLFREAKGLSYAQYFNLVRKGCTEMQANTKTEVNLM